MENFTGLAFLLTGFFLLFAVLFFWIASQASKAKKLFISPRTLFVLLGVVYVALAHFAVISALSYGVELTNLAPCENVVVNSTTSDNVTYEYAYADSCASRSTPKSAENLYVITLYLVFALAISVVIGGMMLFFRGFIKKW